MEIPSRWNDNIINMEWECHLDGINQIWEYNRFAHGEAIEPGRRSR